MPDKRPGFGPPCRSGDMETISVAGVTVTVNRKVSGDFRSFLELFNNTVEPLIPGQTGGYDCRNIAGTDKWSNHAWGLAVDINWNRHPQGRSGTFSPRQVEQIRRLLDQFPDLRWGGDYNTTVDEMHFEWMPGHGGSDDGGNVDFGFLSDAVAFVTDRNNWLRVGWFLLGIILLGLGIYYVAKQTQLGREVINDVSQTASLVSGGRVKIPGGKRR